MTYDEEMRDLLGRCEICGEQATSIVNDFATTMLFDKQWRENPRLTGQHRFCAKHTRPARETIIRESYDEFIIRRSTQ